MASLPDRLATRRLELRPFRAADLAGVVPLVGDWEVARWLARVPHPYTPDDGAAWVALCAQKRAAGRSLDLLAVRREDGVPVGGVSLSLETGELGYWLGLPYQRQGLAAEMVGAVLEWAFGPGGLDDVWACTRPDNEASQALLRRLGFRFTGVETYDFALRGGPGPGHHYRLPRPRSGEHTP